MKHLLPICFSVFVLIVLAISSCKKHKAAAINTTCGCEATEIQYKVNFPGTLLYYDYPKRWMFNYKSPSGFYYVYFPCNMNQDSLKAILRNASNKDTFQVTFAGKVKVICQDENLGYFVGNSAVFNIIIDSLKRN